MTRAEAEEHARAKPELRRLVSFRNCIVDRPWKGIDVILPEGKAGIGNPEAIEVARKALLAELDRQIAGAAGK